MCQRTCVRSMQVWLVDSWRMINSWLSALIARKGWCLTRRRSGWSSGPRDQTRPVWDRHLTYLLRWLTWGGWAGQDLPNRSWSGKKQTDLKPNAPVRYATCSLVSLGHRHHRGLRRFCSKIHSGLRGGLHPLMRQRLILGLAGGNHWSCASTLRKRT